jgi:hypothetical protein
MILQSHSHPWWSLWPFRLNYPRLHGGLFAQFHPQTLMWAGRVVKGLIEDGPLMHLLPVLQKLQRRPTCVAAKDASLAALGEIRGDNAHAAQLRSSIMSARDKTYVHF